MYGLVIAPEHLYIKMYISYIKTFTETSSLECFAPKKMDAQCHNPSIGEWNFALNSLSMIHMG